jgi:dipeptidyl aminopeptidase/acylaminoacyl peptidase
MEGVRRKLAYLSIEDDALSEVEEMLGPYYGGANFSVSRDGSKVAMLKGERNRPPDVWAKELGFLGKRRSLTDLNPWIDDREIGETSVVEWESRDGTRIEGVLYLPPGYQKGTRYPAVISVHGGPQWAWWLGWHGTWHEWALALSCRGFVVLLPNPRGSLGYGVGFARANFDDLGGGDYEDIAAGADYLLREGIADEKRLGICGWSYGGAMTAWAITQTDRFRAAVVGAGVTNLYSFHGTTDITPTFLAKYLREVPYLRPEAYRSHSAVQFVKNAGTPTLVLHGEEDTRVPVGQAYEFYHGLVQTGCRADLVVYPREGHGFSEIRHQIDVVDRIVGWFELYLGE